MRRLLLLVLLLVSSGASAQTDPRSSWFTASLGGSSGRDAHGLVGASAQILAPVGAGPLVVEAGVTSNHALFGGGDEVYEGHVAFGVAGHSGPFHLAVVAGPSVGRVVLTTYDTASGYRRRVGKTGRFLPGAYAGVQGVVALGPVAGISAEAFGLANADLPTAGFRMGVVVGRF